MDIADLYSHYLTSTGVNTDTRLLEKGNLFFALKGDNFNGNAFAEKALEAGASLAIIDDPDYLSENCILVDDVLSTLQELARHHRAKLKIPIIGLTGSNGKTTTKELILAVLKKKYNAVATKGNLNNHIGVPLTILSITDKHEIGIVEMGANHQKEIEFLSSISQPDIGYITNYGKAHLEGFGGVEGVIKGKSELYDYLREHSKIALINCDDKLQVEKSKGINRKILFGSNTGGAYSYKLETLEEDGYLSLSYGSQLIKTKLTGQYNFSNICAAITLGTYFNVPKENIKAAIEEYEPSNNRSQSKQTENNRLILDLYNSNPSSLEAALDNFNSLNSGSKWVIIGDMFEMGEYEAQEHQRLADIAASMDFDKTILVGKAFGKTNSDATKFETTDALINWLKAEKPSQKTILIKGSRGMRLERAIELL